MSVKKEKYNYSIANKYSKLLMSLEPNVVLTNYLDLKFILTISKRLRLGYGLNVLNQAINHAKELGYSGVVVNEKESLTDLIKNILVEFLNKGYIRKESGHYVFDHIIQN